MAFETKLFKSSKEADSHFIAISVTSINVESTTYSDFESSISCRKDARVDVVSLGISKVVSNIPGLDKIEFKLFAAEPEANKATLHHNVSLTF